MTTKPVVLIVDDEAGVRESVRMVLKDSCDPVAVESGEAALDWLATNRCDLVFLDVLMPGIDGTELCQALRGDAALSALPIILLSAMGNRLEQVADQAGATDCLAKPVSIAALKGLVEKYLPRPATS